MRTAMQSLCLGYGTVALATSSAGSQSFNILEVNMFEEVSLYMWRKKVVNVIL